MNRSGFFFLPEEDALNAISLYGSQRYKIFELPKHMVSKDGFFDGVRLVLPLDPPLCSNRSWDALDDSLWSGLDSLLEENILIIWPSAGEMEKIDIKSFEIINEIFENLPKSLSNSKMREGLQLNLVIIGVL